MLILKYMLRLVLKYICLCLCLGLCLSTYDYTYTSVLMLMLILKYLCLCLYLSTYACTPVCCTYSHSSPHFPQDLPSQAPKHPRLKIKKKTHKNIEEKPQKYRRKNITPKTIKKDLPSQASKHPRLTHFFFNFF